MSPHINPLIFWLASAISLALHVWTPSLVIFTQYLSTFAHEAGHCVTAEALSVDCTSFKVFPNGSGMVTVRVNDQTKDILITAAGLLAPPVFAMFMLILSRAFNASAFALLLLAVTLAVTAMVVTNHQFTRMIAFGFAIIFGLTALIANDHVRSLISMLIAVEFGVNGLLSSFSYGFAGEAHIGNGQVLLSDTGQMAAATGASVFVIGSILAAINLLMLYLALSLSTPIGRERR